MEITAFYIIVCGYTASEPGRTLIGTGDEMNGDPTANIVGMVIRPPPPHTASMIPAKKNARQHKRLCKLRRLKLIGSNAPVNKR